MKILVIGGNGKLGKSFCEYFANNGISFLNPSKIELDITSDSSVQHYFAHTNFISHIIICAAYTAVDLAETEKERCFLINKKGIEHILLYNKKIPTINFSTDFVFDGTSRFGYKPDDERNPINVYGMAKGAGETCFESSKSVWANIRISSLISEKSGFKGFLASKIEKNEPLYLCANNLMIPTFADSLVLEVFKHFILTPFSCGHYHLPSKENPMSWYELACFLFPDAKQLFIPIENFKTLAPRPKYSILIRSDV